MHMARNDQLCLPLSLSSLDCFSQSAHFCLSLAHLVLAAFHCLLVHLETSSTLEEIVGVGEGVGAALCASAAAATKTRMATAQAVRVTGMVGSPGIALQRERRGAAAQDYAASTAAA